MKKFKLMDPEIVENLRVGGLSDKRKDNQDIVYTPPVYPKYKTPDPELHNLGQLDGKMKQIVESEGIDIHSKIEKYNKVLEDYLNFYRLHTGNTYKQRIEHDEKQLIPEKTVPKNILNALQNVPKTLRQKAQSIIDTIKDSDVLSWDETGHLLYKGSLVPNSNIADIINDSLRYRKSAKRPIGWESFAKGAQELNIPRTLITNPVYYTTANIDDEFHSAGEEKYTTSDASESLDLTLPTPTYSRRSRSRRRPLRRQRKTSLSRDLSDSGSPISWIRKSYL